MAAPTIRLATSEDMRSITSQSLDDIKRLPLLYIATVEPDVMRTRGIAGEATVGDSERLYPGSSCSSCALWEMARQIQSVSREHASAALRAGGGQRSGHSCGLQRGTVPQTRLFPGHRSRPKPHDRQDDPDAGVNLESMRIRRASSSEGTQDSRGAA